MTDYALEWLKQDREKPFFLYLSHKAVHAMFMPAKRHLGKYDSVQLEYPESMADTEENYRGKPQWVKEQRNSWHGVDYMYYGHMDFDTFYRRYCETLLGIDESIGKVLDYLEDAGLAESTLVMYMGDNGFCFGEHGLIDKRHMYEESMRVPLLAHCPEIIQPGTKISQMIQNIDISETILDAAGLKSPDNMDGRSFLPLLRSEEIPWRDAVFYEYYWERNYPQTPTVHGIRTDRYKYIHYHGIWDIDELYDLQNDPEEMHNLIGSPEHRELVREFNKRVFDWLDETGGMLIPLRRDSGNKIDQRKPSG
jgi:arylsulfatase A-like enzyme